MEKLIRRSLKTEIHKDLSDEAIEKLAEDKIKISQDSPVLEVIVNSGKLDRDNEVLNIKGLDFKDYRENPVVGWGHDYKQPAIGKALKIWKANDGTLKAVIEFATEIYPFAKLIYNLYKEKFMNAFSIGFRALEAEEDKDDNIIFTKAEMYEFSAVFVGADPKALQRAKSIGYDTDVLEKVEHGDLQIKDYKGKANSLEIDLNDIDQLEKASEMIEKILDIRKPKPESDIVKNVEIVEKAMKNVKKLSRKGRGDLNNLNKAKLLAQIGDKAGEMVIKDLKVEINKIKENYGKR